ncbi:MAG: hypothetical protein LBL79_04420 [Prevotella sp.]|jgi:hypothetical protein|nr:hypothetical protein [Prevotella sp.]
MMDRQLKRTIGVMSKPEIEKVYPHFAIGFQQDIVEFLAKNKLWPKMLLDQLFLDGNTSLITSRQYRRNFVIERKADYEKFAAEFNAYDKYVEEVIAPRRYDNIDKEYFRQSMDFYFLEVHSRLDFMYKFAETLEVLENKNEGSSNLLKIRFLIEPYSVYAYCPLVVPDEKGDTHLEFVIEKREYFPIMLTEKSSKRTLLDILREPDDNPFLEDNAINFCRAKTLELFKYHHVFVSDNYKEISDFIRNNYDILSYHEKNKIWKVLKNKPTAAQKRSIKTIEMINNYLFPNVYPMNRSEWRKSNKNNAAAISEKHEKIDEAKVKELKDEDYFTLFGMDKGTFEKILGILESAYKESHTSGGRPASLSVLKRLAVTIEYRRNKRSMGNIACDYGVSKSRINDAIKWVEKTVTESESGASLSEAFYSGRS